MRKALFFLVLASFTACNSDKEAKVQSMTTNDSTAAESIKYPPVDNSIKYEIADAKVTATMLELYTKGVEENSLEPAKKLFADTLTIVGGDGTILSGSRDKVLAGVRADWDKYTSQKPIYHSFVSLKSTDRDDTWFLIWLKLHTTDKKGKKDSLEIMENWKLNKEGKVTAVYQYQQNHPIAAKK